MLQVIDFIDAAIFLTPVLAAATWLGWGVLGFMMPRAAR